MGKIISRRLATDDYDPMGLLGTTDVFKPKKHVTDLNKKPVKPKKNSKKIIISSLKEGYEDGNN